MTYFKTPGQPYGDRITAFKKFAYIPRRVEQGKWLWWKHYYIVDRWNAMVHDALRYDYSATIFLSEEEYVVFKLTFV